MRTILLASLVILLAACGKPQEVLTVSTTQVELKKAPDPAAETARYANFGDVFKARQRKDGWWRVFLDDGTSVYAKGGFSPYPIPASDLYVSVPATARFVTPDEASRDLSAKYRIGEKLTVARGMDWIPEGWGSVIEKGKPTGWVLLKALAPEQPTAAQLVDSAITSLRSGQYAEAIADAERAFVLDTRDKGTLTLVVALHEARADAEASVWREKLGPARKRAELPITVKKGADAYVAIEEAELREKAADDAEELAKLAIATKVKVDDVQGKWAKVTWEGVADGERILEVDPFAVAPVVATTAATIVEAPPTTTGWMRAGALAKDAPDRESLRKKGLELVRAAKHDEGFDLLIRAAAIPPVDVAIWGAILDEALKAKAWEPAARAAIVRSQGGGSLGGFDVTLAVHYGCRGDIRSNPEILDADTIDFSARIPVDACVNDLDADECPPCDDYHDEHDYYEEGSEEPGEETAENESSEPETEEQRKEREEQERLEAEAEEARQRQAEEEEAARQAEIAAAAEAEAAAQEERDRWQAKLDEVFSSGAYVVVTVRNATATRSQAGQKLVFYEVPASEGYNGSAYYTAQSLRTGTITIPSLGPQESVDLWIQVSQYRDIEWGVMATENADDVLTAINLWNEQAASNEPGYYEEPSEESESEAEEDPWEEPPHVSTSNLSPSCDCGGC